MSVRALIGSCLCYVWYVQYDTVRIWYMQYDTVNKLSKNGVLINITVRPNIVLFLEELEALDFSRASNM